MRVRMMMIACLAMAGGCVGGPQESQVPSAPPVPQEPQIAMDAIMGHWCTANATYDFTEDKLTVKSPRLLRVLHVKLYRIDGARIVVSFVEDDARQNPADRGRGSHATYSEFGGGRMLQMSEKRYDGSSTPNVELHRC